MSVAAGTPRDEARGRAALRERLEAAVGTREMALAVAIVVFGFVVQTQNSDFLRYENIILVFKAAAPAFIVALATTFVLVGGGLDLSLGSVAALGGVLTGELLLHGTPIALAIIAGLVGCMLVGALNGVLVATFGIPSLIVTLGALYSVRGVTLEITQAERLFPFPDSFNEIGQGEVAGVPLLVIYAVVLGVLAHVVLNHTRYGYHVRAVGGGAEAARASGINVTRVRISLYVLSAAGAATTGILLASRLGTADPTTGQGLELTAISAVIIGGTSLFGGVGNIVGTVLGSILLALIENGLLLMSVSPFYQQIVVGCVVVAAVGLDAFRRSRLWGRRAARMVLQAR